LQRALPSLRSRKRYAYSLRVVSLIVAFCGAVYRYLRYPTFRLVFHVPSIAIAFSDSTPPALSRAITPPALNGPTNSDPLSSSRWRSREMVSGVTVNSFDFSGSAALGGRGQPQSLAGDLYS
jgi:hypothetical protein